MIEITTYKNGIITPQELEDSYIPNGFDCGTGDELAVQPFACTIGCENRTGWILEPTVMDPGKKYPVLYLLHGLGGQAYSEWVQNGNIVQIVGNLLLNKQIQPMIYVMPDIIRNMNEDEGTRMGDFRSFINIMQPPNGSMGLMDYIKKTYPVSQEKSNSSIAGLSIGALASLYIGCELQDDFYSVGSFSPSAGLLPSNGRKGWLLNDSCFTFGTGQDHFIFIGRGDQDTTVNKYPDSYRDALDKNKNDNTFYTLPGGHNWDVFKRLFYLFLRNNIFDNQTNL